MSLNSEPGNSTQDENHPDFQPQNRHLNQGGYASLQQDEDYPRAREIPLTSFDIETNPENPQQSPEKPVPLFWIYLLIIWFFAISILLVLIFTFNYEDGEVSLKLLKKALDALSHNLNQDPIIDLKLVHHKEVCPQNFEKTVLGTWPGTEKGCKCAGDRVEKFPCDLKNEDICLFVTKLSPSELQKWQNSSICVRRAIPEREYFKHPICPSGFKQCSPGFCFLDSLECPITKLKISEAESGSVGMFTNATNTRYLTALRTPEKNPLVDFAITPNGIPCFSFGEAPAGTTEPYALLSDRNGCGNYGADTEWSFAIEEQAQDEILSNNGIEKYLTTALPDYANVIRNTQVLLSGRNRITVANKEECLNLNKELFAFHVIEKFERILRDMEYTSIFCSFFHVLVRGVTFFFFLRLVFRGGNELQKAIKKDRDALIILTRFGWLEILILTGAFVRGLLAYFVISKSTWYFQKLNQIGCFPVGQPSQILEDFSIWVHSYASIICVYCLLLIFFSFCVVFSAQRMKRKIPGWGRDGNYD